MITDTIHRKNCIQQKEEKPKNVIKWAFLLLLQNCLKNMQNNVDKWGTG